MDKEAWLRNTQPKPKYRKLKLIIIEIKRKKLPHMSMKFWGDVSLL